jgi:hypothetical protein
MIFDSKSAETALTNSYARYQQATLPVDVFREA